MKSTAFLVALLLVGFSDQAQKKVKEKDLKGHWQMVFDFDDDFMKEKIE